MSRLTRAIWDIGSFGREVLCKAEATPPKNAMHLHYDLDNHWWSIAHLMSAVICIICSFILQSSIPIKMEYIHY